MIITKWDSLEKQTLLLNSGNKKKTEEKRLLKKMLTDSFCYV